MDIRSLSADVREPFASVPVGSGDMAMVEGVAVNSRIDETQRGGGYNYVSISIVLVFMYFLTVGKVHKCSGTQITPARLVLLMFPPVANSAFMQE